MSEKQALPSKQNHSHVHTCTLLGNNDGELSSLLLLDRSPDDDVSSLFPFLLRSV
jgi:hypothetical protein